ncbi:hypothetical protein [Georgenia faecalis]|uniref:hypothetical protein n=1 Tax=Georgenia faecalis TaxID=2483799 RepID=UPI000FDA50C1|nr:hypothetical protein [Georgenia faecalis]
MRSYATPADLATGDWLEDTPANAARLLRAASTLVANATRTAVYDVDTDGMPTGRAAEAMRDATCAQAATWVALGIDPAKGRADDGSKTVAAKTIRGASFQYAVYASTAEARQAAATTLTDEAILILRDAGLTATVSVVG